MTALKDYWIIVTFIVTILVSGVTSLFYFAVFEINPFDKPYEVSIRIKHTRLHNQIGRTLLLQGHYDKARQEYTKALEFRPYDREALNGRLFSELFGGLGAVEWTPSASAVVLREIDQLDLGTDAAMMAVREKYRGDLALRLTDADTAKGHFQKALELHPAYADALFTQGWLAYQRDQIEEMRSVFQRMADLGDADYRAFHGLGYAQYMLALRQSDGEKRQELLREAAAQSGLAANLQVNHLNVVADLGEVARCIDPNFAIYYHKLAQQLLDDPKLSQLPENQMALGVRLLLKDGYYVMRTEAQKRAYVKYQMALDHLAGFRLRRDPESQRRHQTLLAEAKKLDEDAMLLPIYEEGIRIIDLLIE
jgi:tetratricopeptide (TPR) repeat protein